MDTVPIFLAPKDLRRRYSDAEIAEVKQRLANGERVKRIAAETSVSEWLVYKIKQGLNHKERK